VPEATHTLVAALQSIRPEEDDLTLRESWMETGDAPVAPIEPGEGYAVGPLLGRGGTSLIKLATQRALDRTVAIKSMRPGKDQPHHAQMLLREAWITGALEHPNIIPVYDITQDAAGKPLIVLKRVEGRSWEALIEGETLERNLRILSRVCNAVHFAHERGFMHRDLKPANVMVGEFGEVYLVDWGLALRIQPDGDRRIPLAGSSHKLAGTPAYMAPEMLGEGEPLTRLTDVYQLGATLFHLLTGKPPWYGEVGPALFDRVRASEVALPPEVSSRLSAISRRAMSCDPSERYPTALAFRDALREYQRHRGADDLAVEARSRLDKLASAVTRSSASRSALYDLHGQCRFGFQQALAAWPEHAEARAGLTRADALMASYELDRGDLTSATAMMVGLDDPALEARAAALAEEQAEREARIDALEEQQREMDPRIGQRDRLWLVAGMGLLWATLSGAGGALSRWIGAPSWALTLSMDVFFVGLVAGLAWSSRNTVLTTAFNRQVVGMVLLALGLQLPVDLGSYVMGLDEPTAHTFHPMIWATVTGALAVLRDPRLAPTSIGFLMSFLLAAVWPEWLFLAISAGCLLMTANIVALWGRPERA